MLGATCNTPTFTVGPVIPLQDKSAENAVTASLQGICGSLDQAQENLVYRFTVPVHQLACLQSSLCGCFLFT